MKKKFRFSPIAYDGWKFVLGFGFIGFLFLFFGILFAKGVGIFSVFLALFSMFFFRDPERKIPKTDDILCPADGTVLEVSTIDGEGYGQGRVVRIFMSVFDVHIQRAPVAGMVKSLSYAPGIFLDTRDPRAPFANESNTIEITTDRGRVMVKQIAGLIARRIVCWVRPEDVVESGERIGLIRYGSQVDLYVPMEVEVCVKDGAKVTAGQTILGRWPSQ